MLANPTMPFCSTNTEVRVPSELSGEKKRALKSKLQNLCKDDNEYLKSKVRKRNAAEADAAAEMVTKSYEAH